MATRSRGAAPAQAAPETVPLPPQTTPPAGGGGGDYSPFVWKQLGDIQQAMGRIEASISQLQREQEKADEKMGKIEDKLSGVTHKLYAAGVILTIAVVVGGFLVNKAWDLMATAIAAQAAAAKATQPAEGAAKKP